MQQQKFMYHDFLIALPPSRVFHAFEILLLLARVSFRNQNNAELEGTETHIKMQKDISLHKSQGLKKVTFSHPSKTPNKMGYQLQLTLSIII